MSFTTAEVARRRQDILGRIAARLPPRADPEAALLAVGKGQPVAALQGLAACGQRRFGENYVQEAARKRQALNDPGLEWHLIGPLQSNKCRLAAETFDWIHSIDRLRIVDLLARERAASRRPLQVLLQINIDDESSKAGCAPGEVDALVDAVNVQPHLTLRGLMAIPAPQPDPERRRDAFRRMRVLFSRLRQQHPGIDTLSMGMSDDFEVALEEGATLVRIGTALFGPRPAR